MRHPLLPETLLSCAALLACGAPGTPGPSSDGDAGGSSAAASSGDATPTTAATSTAASDDSTGAPQTVDAVVVRHPSQPMVVDVILTTSAPASSLALVDEADPGVVSEVIAASGLSTTFRVRGLAPGTPHSLRFHADGVEGTVDFITDPPRPGFIPSFEVEGRGSDPARPYRMFDLIPFPVFDTASAFMVDARGTTRWHIGAPSTGMAGPEGVFTALTLRADGTLMFLHEHTLHIRDELDTPLLELSDDLLGVTGLHHEVAQLPGGNFIALSFAFEDVDYGLPGVLTTAGDVIVEFTAAGEVVWTWNAFDHLDPLRVTEPFATALVQHPTTLEATYDWTHGNAVVHDPVTDTLLLSLRHQDWILAIDHKTGEVLWKLGAGGDFELLGAGPWFYHQHAPEWQEDGTLLLYDNGVGNPDIPPAAVRSRAVRYALDLQAMTAERVWEDDGEPILAPFAGNADRLPGGHILATDSTLGGLAGLWSQIRELDENAAPMLQWSLRTPLQFFIYRATAHDRLIGQAAP